MLRLARLAQAQGLDGVVCSAQEAAALKRALGPAFKLVTPGIRPAGAATPTRWPWRATSAAGRPHGAPAVTGVRNRWAPRPHGLPPSGAATQDQARVMTPVQAIAAGADYLVIGRPTTAAPDPLAALDAINASIASGAHP